MKNELEYDKRLEKAMVHIDKLIGYNIQKNWCLPV